MMMITVTWLDKSVFKIQLVLQSNKKYYNVGDDSNDDSCDDDNDDVKKPLVYMSIDLVPLHVDLSW